MGRFHLVVRCLLLAAATVVSGPAFAQLGLPGLPGGSSSTVTQPLEMSCEGVDAIACKSVGRLEYVGVCDDDDGDGVCNRDDRCPETPAETPVFLDGCHLTADQPAVLTGVRFEFDSARLRPESRVVLDQAVAVLGEQTGVYVSIDGHTDAKGGEAYNQRLSYARARSVFDYFRAAGIDTARLVYRGFGESRPVAPNQHEDGSDNPAGRALNRRVELTVVDEIEFQSIRSDNRARATSPVAPATESYEVSYEAEATVEADESDVAPVEEEEPSVEEEPSADEEPSAENSVEDSESPDSDVQEQGSVQAASAGQEDLDEDEAGETGSDSGDSSSDDNVSDDMGSEESASDTADSAEAEEENDDYGEWDDLDYLD